MAAIIEFQPRPQKPGAAREGSAQILFFTGVRYERMAEEDIAPPKKRKGPPTRKSGAAARKPGAQRRA